MISIYHEFSIDQITSFIGMTETNLDILDTFYTMTNYTYINSLSLSQPLNVSSKLNITLCEDRLHKTLVTISWNIILGEISKDIIVWVFFDIVLRWFSSGISGHRLLRCHLYFFTNGFQLSILPLHLHRFYKLLSYATHTIFTKPESWLRDTKTRKGKERAYTSLGWI